MANRARRRREKRETLAALGEIDARWPQPTALSAQRQDRPGPGFGSSQPGGEDR